MAVKEYRPDEIEVPEWLRKEFMKHLTAYNLWRFDEEEKRRVREDEKQESPQTQLLRVVTEYPEAGGQLFREFTQLANNILRDLQNPQRSIRFSLPSAVDDVREYVPCRGPANGEPCKRCRIFNFPCPDPNWGTGKFMKL